MYQNFKWTPVAEERNRFLKRSEPLQPFVLWHLAKALGADTFVDVGANIGAYSILLSDLPVMRRIHAFEASRETAAELRRNLALNERAHTMVVVHMCAATDKAQSLSFGVVKDFAGANSVVETSFHAEHDPFRRTDTVQGLPLDMELTERGQKLCLKIDVEGHEAQVLAGARELLMNNEAVIQIENWRGRDSAQETMLAHYGYEHIFGLGHDLYYTNARHVLTDSAVLVAVEEASTQFIEASQTWTTNGAVKLNLPGGISLHLSGPAATLARKLRHGASAH